MDSWAPLLLVPVVFVNSWHAYLLFAIRHNKHAIISKNKLYFHRLAHCLSSIALLFYANKNHALFGWTVAFLICGAVFDILEVITLNKNISKSPIDFTDPHQLTSWLMANSYMLFMMFGGAQIGLDFRILLLFLAFYSSLFAIGVRTKFIKFWRIQMLYFVVLSFNLLILSNHI